MKKAMARLFAGDFFSGTLPRQLPWRLVRIQFYRGVLGWIGVSCHYSAMSQLLSMDLFSPLACWWELMLLRPSSFWRKKASVFCLSWWSEVGIFCALLAWWDRSRAAKTSASICLSLTCSSTAGFSSSGLGYRDHGSSSSWECSVWSGLHRQW